VILIKTTGDFVIGWLSNYANLYEIYISRIEKGMWQLRKRRNRIYGLIGSSPSDELQRSDPSW
jgi:hypothetical protein